jgi:hypothetical protein
VSAQAVGHVWRYADFGGAKLLVLLAVADIANDVHNNELWMGSEKLANKCRMNPGNVRKRLKELVEDGWLIELVTGGGMGKTSRYQFVPVDITASPGAEAEPNRVNERAEPRPTARLYKENSNELKTKKDDSVSCVADRIVDNDGPKYQRHHAAHQIDTNTAGIARARSALTDGDNNNNPANNPPPPANT